MCWSPVWFFDSCFSIWCLCRVKSLYGSLLMGLGLIAWRRFATHRLRIILHQHDVNMKSESCLWGGESSVAVQERTSLSSNRLTTGTCIIYASRGISCKHAVWNVISLLSDHQTSTKIISLRKSDSDLSHFYSRVTWSWFYTDFFSFSFQLRVATPKLFYCAFN
jgi:hypothetical protein